MKVSTKQSNSEFIPFEIKIKIEIETKEEAEILWRLSNLSDQRMHDVINAPYNSLTAFTKSAMKEVTDGIYYAIENGKCGIYKSEVTPINVNTPERK